MKAAVLLNGEPYSGEISADRVFCCDGAYNWARGRVGIDENIGDFDSVSDFPDPPPERIYPAEKNFTDGEIALAQAIREGADEIVFYGFSGGRSDHFLGNLHLMYAAFSKGVKCSAVTDGEIFMLGSGKIFLGEFVGLTFSVLPFGGDLHIIESAGLKYAYPAALRYGECRGISNVCLSGGAFVEVSGCALVIINRGKV